MLGFSLLAVNAAFAQSDKSGPARAATSAQQAPVGEQPAVKSTKFEDWYYRCVDVKTADGRLFAQCEVAQIAQVNRSGKDVNILTLRSPRRLGDPAKKDKKQASDFC